MHNFLVSYRFLNDFLYIFADQFGRVYEASSYMEIAGSALSAFLLGRAQMNRYKPAQVNYVFLVSVKMLCISQTHVARS